MWFVVRAAIYPNLCKKKQERVETCLVNPQGRILKSTIATAAAAAVAAMAAERQQQPTTSSLTKHTSCGQSRQRLIHSTL